LFRTTKGKGKMDIRAFARSYEEKKRI
jgi:hypothetical protein